MTSACFGNLTLLLRIRLTHCYHFRKGHQVSCHNLDMTAIFEIYQFMMTPRPFEYFSNDDPLENQSFLDNVVMITSF